MITCESSPEARIIDDRYYIFADPAVLPVLEYAYLSSAQGPQLASRAGLDVLGMEFRVVLDFGCGAVDFKGAYLNPGSQVMAVSLRQSIPRMV